MCCVNVVPDLVNALFIMDPYAILSVNSCTESVIGFYNI